MLPKLQMDTQHKESLIYALTDRVLNADVGSLVKGYMKSILTRINDVSFRKRLAVKCESNNI